MITIVDYGVGNINAFVNVFKRVDIPVKVAKNSVDLEGAEKLVLPGVGSFDHSMTQLNNSGMREKLDSLVLEDKIGVIGICVGMQMMANSSEEGNLDGLKWIDGTVKKLNPNLIPNTTKLPHMGWNEVKPAKDNLIFKDLDKDALFYFVHSYYFHCNNPENILAVSEYGQEFTSATQRENIYGILFHPEKSHRYGEILMHNFAKL